MARRAQPGDQTHQVAFCHRCASRGRSAFAAPDVEKNRAPLARHRWIRIMANLDQPAIGKVVMPHFLLLEPGRRMSRIINRDKAVVLRTLDIIDPGIGCRYLVKWIISARRQLRIVSINLPHPKDTGRSATVVFFLAETRFILSGQASAPCSTSFAEKNRNWRSHWVPIAACFSFK